MTRLRTKLAAETHPAEGKYDYYCCCDGGDDDDDDDNDNDECQGQS
jgi:hypothetical protein